MNRPRPPCLSRPSLRLRMRGLSLIELMIAIVLGMLVVAAAGAIFISNKQTYTATESLGRVQENSRVAFELMARDIREASASACDSTMQSFNMLNTVSWWSNLSNGIKGYDTGAAGAPVGSLKNAIDIVSATADTYAVQAMTAPDATILTTANHDLGTGGILMICDFKCATVFQDTGPAASGSNNQINHVAGTSVTPGNSAAALKCTNPVFSPHSYGVDAVVSRVRASRWYVANNAVGGQSLYRAQVLQGVQQAGQEIVEGVTDMELTYLTAGGTAYVAASAITDWTQVVAVNISLTLLGNDRVGTDGSKLSRTLSNVVYLRDQKL